RFQPLAACRNERAEICAAASSTLEIGGEPRRFGRITPLLLLDEPAPDPFLLHGYRERLVERRVVLDVDQLVRKLMEDEARKLYLAVARKRRQHRIVEIAERRIRRHAADVN